MKRTSAWLAILGIAMLGAIWFVNGPLQSSVAPDGPTTSPRPEQVSAPSQPVPGAATVLRAATETGILPANSVDEIFALPHDFSQTHAAYALAAAAADATAIEALIADAQAVTRRGDRDALTTIFLSRYSEIDPRAAIEFLEQGDLESKPDHLYRIFEGWSKIDLDAAIAAAGDLETGAEQQAAVAAILRAHSESGAGAVALLMGRLLAAGVTGNPQLRSAIQSASGEPEAALAAALALPRDQAEMLVSNIGMGWAIQDPEAAFAYSRTMEDPALRRRMVSGVFYSWIDRDPERVMGFLDGDLTSDERSALINTGLARVAQRDPERALELSLRVDNFVNLQMSLQRTFRTWADSDPAAAAAALEGIDTGNLAVLIKEVAPDYARAAPAAALEWAKRIGDGQHSLEVIAAVALEDLALARDAAFSLPEADQSSAIVRIAQALIVEDVAKATDFWMQLPEEHRSVAMMGMVAYWSQNDPVGAADWVRSMPRSPGQQQAVRTLLTSLNTSADITNYVQLLGMLDSGEDRDALGYQRISWLVRNGRREQAEAEIDRLTLSPDAYRRARETIAAGGFGR